MQLKSLICCVLLFAAVITDCTSFAHRFRSIRISHISRESAQSLSLRSSILDLAKRRTALILPILKKVPRNGSITIIFAAGEASQCIVFIDGSRLEYWSIDRSRAIAHTLNVCSADSTQFQGTLALFLQYFRVGVRRDGVPKTCQEMLARRCFASNYKFFQRNDEYTIGFVSTKGFAFYRTDEDGLHYDGHAFACPLDEDMILSTASSDVKKLSLTRMEALTFLRSQFNSRSDAPGTITIFFPERRITPFYGLVRTSSGQEIFALCSGSAGGKISLHEEWKLKARTYLEVKGRVPIHTGDALQRNMDRYYTGLDFSKWSKKYSSYSEYCHFEPAEDGILMFRINSLGQQFDEGACGYSETFGLPPVSSEVEWTKSGHRLK